MSTLESIIEIFDRVTKNSGKDFPWLRVECNSWVSAYEYIRGRRAETPAEVNQLSQEVESIQGIKCEKSSNGRLVLLIPETIRGKKDEEMEQGATGASSSDYR